MNSTDSMSSFFAQPRGTAGQQQSTDSIRSTQMRIPQMSQGMGMGSGAGTGTVPRTTSGASTVTTQRQTDIPSMPGMDSMRQPGTLPRMTQQQTDASLMPGMDSMRQQPGALPRTSQQQIEVPPMPETGTMRQPGAIPRTPQQQIEVPPMPEMGSMRQPGAIPRTPQQQMEVPPMPEMGSMRQPGAIPRTPQQQMDVPPMPEMGSMRQPEVFPRTTQQQIDFSTEPDIGSMRQQGTPMLDTTGERSIYRTPSMGAPELEYPELLQLSLQEALSKNIGEYVVVEFLIGTNMIEKKQGILYNVGLSYIIIYEEQSKTFIICDLYSIKFVTFYLPGQKPPQQPTGGQNMRGR